MISGLAKSRRWSRQPRQSLARLASRLPSLIAAVFFSLAALSPSIAQTTALGPRFVLPYQTVVDSTGTPVPGALLYFYASGTNTPLTTYSDALLTVPNLNPVRANAAGVFPNIFMVGNYKVVLTDSLGNQLWTADPVSGANVIQNPMIIGGNAMTFPGVASSIAPLASPIFTGTITGPDTGTWGASGIRSAFNGSIGGTAPAAGAFTTLAASGAVSGAGFSAYLASYLASPPAIGGTAPAAVSATSVSATSVSATSVSATSLNFANLADSKTAPTITSGCGTGSPSISAPNGTDAFVVTIGGASGSSCTLGMPTATTGWVCFANDLTTHTTANSTVMQTASSASAVTVTGYSDITGVATWVSGDKIAFLCRAY